MWRRYCPKTNRFRLARICISHGPLDGKRMGVDGAKRGRWDAGLGLGHWPRNDQRTRGANVDGTQVPECFGQLGRPKRLVAPDIDASQKNNEGHPIPLNESVLEEDATIRAVASCFSWQRSVSAPPRHPGRVFGVRHLGVAMAQGRNIKKAPDFSKSGAISLNKTLLVVFIRPLPCPPPVLHRLSRPCRR